MSLSRRYFFRFYTIMHFHFVGGKRRTPLREIPSPTMLRASIIKVLPRRHRKSFVGGRGRAFPRRPEPTRRDKGSARALKPLYSNLSRLPVNRPAYFQTLRRGAARPLENSICKTISHNFPRVIDSPRCQPSDSVGFVSTCCVIPLSLCLSRVYRTLSASNICNIHQYRGADADK